MLSDTEHSEWSAILSIADHWWHWSHGWAVRAGSQRPSPDASSVRRTSAGPAGRPAASLTGWATLPRTSTTAPRTSCRTGCAAKFCCCRCMDAGRRAQSAAGVLTEVTSWNLQLHACSWMQCRGIMQCALCLAHSSTVNQSRAIRPEPRLHTLFTSDCCCRGQWSCTPGRSTTTAQG